ncbi:WecB/TagA/CpsF family glycosyltransferase [Candidatus Uhrbacteria bacterium]|nr:WecB/TagA/CpsF family glycosyltransferase [Candidatus Uhrbacteria bacterium]
MTPHRHRHRATILGLPVDHWTKEEFRRFLEQSFLSNRTHRVVTLNPEIALAAYEHPRYAATIRTADGVTPDGVGIVLAAWVTGQGGSRRHTGTDLLDAVCAIATARHQPVAFLLHTDGLTSPARLRTALQQRWPGLSVAIASIRPTGTIEPGLLRAIADHAPAALFVNFGHPVQEEWLAAHLDHFPSVRIAAGLGGAIDYCSGAVAPPPALVRRCGMEWMWRLLRQPKRFRRIIRATMVFPATMISVSIRRLFSSRAYYPAA